ncbi:MAG: MBL fold metallo-hydrolase, partial [Nanoarchaeota archaeon]|nr:MBL fold metallo-hydrolase [Nanoarchaeota archaeon]
FRGKVFVTPPTKDLAEITLTDSCGILERESREKGTDPLFKEEDVRGILNLMHPIKYGKKHKIEGEIYFKLNDAGHMLGSSIIEIWAEGKKIVFSGDLGNAPTPLLKPPTKIDQADYILVESTYGNKIHENREKRKEIFENIIEETYSQKGVLMIPAFAVERTQELLMELDELVHNSRIPKIPIFIDSPLAVKATKIYGKYPEYFNKQAQEQIKNGDDFFKFPGLIYTEEVDASKRINQVSPPKIIIAGSGMSVGGRILFHEKMYLPDSRNCLLITNYQVKGTLGRKLLEGEKEIKIFDEIIQVRAKIVSIEGYSSHADQKGVYDWLNNFTKPVKHIWTVQGEPEPSEALALLVKDHLGIPASAPKLGEVVEL